MKKYFFVLILFFFAQETIHAELFKYKKKSVTQLKQLTANNLRSDTVDILKYTINLTVTDFTNKIISGNTKITFTPKINNVNKLNLDLLVLSIDSVKNGGSHLTYSYNDTLLSVNLSSAYSINDTSSIVVFYHGTPQIDHPSAWGGFYFQSGFAYNLGVGFDANPHVYGRVWFPCFDNFTERSTYEFNITTNNGKIAYCNGYLANDTTDGLGNRTRKWIMDKEIPTYLASVSIGNYTQINKTYNGINGTIPIVIAALPTDTTAVKNSFVNLNLALSTFENHFGAYKWNKVGYCMVPFSSGAMEHATNITYPKTFANGTTTYQTLYAHELSHHWFGDLATCRTQEDMWLNEGWAHYCEFIFTEALSGHTAYLNDVRTNHEENLHFLHVKESGYLTLSNIPSNYTYGDHVYNKGADIAHTMRGYMGDSLFFYSIKTYLSQNNYKDVSSNDFKNALTIASGINMDDFFNGWVFNPGWPHFSIDSFLIVPSGNNYNVCVFLKQKLTGAPNYFMNVPLEVTFKSADWSEKTESIIMSGAKDSFNFTIPFKPVFISLNMGEKISDAIAPEIKKIKTVGTFNFTNTKMILNVTNISDSAFVRVEHNYTAPDDFKTPNRPYRLSPNHYWKVDGILPANFKAKATLNYDGRTSAFSGNYWLDNNLITTVEDSLVLMYRRNASSDWNIFPYYSKNMISNNTDKRGTITIDSLELGEYAFAMKDYLLGINNNEIVNKSIQIKIYPNPTKDIFTIDLQESLIKIQPSSYIVITDTSAKVMFKEKINQQQNTLNLSTAGFSNGVYFISIKTKDAILAKTKFIVAH